MNEEMKEPITEEFRCVGSGLLFCCALCIR